MYVTITNTSFSLWLERGDSKHPTIITCGCLDLETRRTARRSEVGVSMALRLAYRQFCSSPDGFTLATPPDSGVPPVHSQTMHVRHAMQQHSTEGKNNMQVTNNACEFIKNQLRICLGAGLHTYRTGGLI